MALTEGLISKPLLTFLQTQNKTTQTDPQAAMQNFCNELETIIFNAIKSVTLVIPSTEIQVQGANSGGPVVSINESPLTINQALQ